MENRIIPILIMSAIIIIIIFIAIIFIGVLFLLFKNKDNIKNFLKELANIFNIKINDYNLKKLNIKFTYKNRQIHIYTEEYREKTLDFTNTISGLPTSRANITYFFCVKLYKDIPIEGYLEVIRKAKLDAAFNQKVEQKNPIPTNNKEFDLQYFVLAKPKDLTLLLTDQIQEKIIQLKASFHLQKDYILFKEHDGLTVARGAKRLKEIINLLTQIQDSI